MSRARENADGARLDAPLASPAFTGTPTGITGTHITSGTLGNTVQDNITRLGTVTSGNLSNTAIVYPAGHVIQVVSPAYTGGSFSTSSTTFVDNGLTATITPLRSSSKILVLVDIQISAVSSGTSGWGSWRLLRGATELSSNTRVDMSSLYNHHFNSLSFLDSPATTSATTYKTQVLSSNASYSLESPHHTNKHSITLMEIAQ